MVTNYSQLRNELKSLYSTYDFASEMQKAVMNEVWRNRTPFWTLLSASCNDAAAKCFEQINKYIENLADIDTCSVHALKNFAKEVDLDFLCKNFSEDYPLDVLELINLLSIPRQQLFNYSKILHPSATNRIYGSAAFRAKSTNKQTIEIDLIIDMINNMKGLKKILANALMTETTSIRTALPYGVNYSKDLNSEIDILDLPLKALFEAIDSFNDLDKLDKYTNQTLFISDECPKKWNFVNFFYLLSEIVKQNIYNPNTKLYLETSYFDDDLNSQVDLEWLVFDLINSFQTDNEIYVRNFISYHFYYMIKDKLVNDYLKEMYYKPISKSKRKSNDYVMVKTKTIEYSKEQFVEKLSDFLDDEQIEKFIKTNNITHNYCKYFVEFAEYLAFLNKYAYRYYLAFKDFHFSDGTSYEDEWNDNKHLFKDNGVVYNLLAMNFSDDYVLNDETTMSHFKEFLYGNYDYINENYVPGLIYEVAKEMTDVCITITYARENIKSAIQQFSFIGTSKTISESLRDFYIKNFTKRSDWGYISNINQTAQKEEELSSLIQSVSSLIKNKNTRNNFGIDVIEYYDTTQYLNISSELGVARVGDHFVGEYETTSAYVDDNYNILTSTVKIPYYEADYVPCATIVHAFNDRFWNDTDSFVSGMIFNQYTDFASFYASNDPALMTVNDKFDYVSKSVLTTLGHIWDAFALVGTKALANQIDSFTSIYNQYIGDKEIGTNYYLNLENKLFPTIAASLNIENLKEVEKYDKDDVLMLARHTYIGTADQISSYCISFLSSFEEVNTTISNHYTNYFDVNGLPVDGWKKARAIFHGYETDYEKAENVSNVNSKIGPEFDVDGAVAYGKSKELYYMLANNTELSAVIDFLCDNVKNDADFGLISANYARQLKKTDSKYDNIYFSSSESIPLCDQKIDKYEKDDIKNNFILFKNSNEDIYGKLFIRTNEMYVPLPLFDDEKNDDQFDMISFTNKPTYQNDFFATLNIFKTVSNNCIDFGIYANSIWMFGKDDERSRFYVIFIRNYGFKKHHLYVSFDDIKFVSFNEDIKWFSYLNEFVGAKINEDDNSIDFYLFNQDDNLKKLKKEEDLLFEQNLLDNATFDFMKVRHSFEKEQFDKEYTDVYETISINRNHDLSAHFPCIYDVDDEGSAQSIDDRRIWKLVSQNSNLHILYESLSPKAIDDTKISNAYYDNTILKLSFQKLILNFDFERYHFADENGEKSSYTFSKYVNIVSSNINETFVFKNENVVGGDLFEKTETINDLVEFFKSYPSCKYDASRLTVTLIPYAFYFNNISEANEKNIEYDNQIYALSKYLVENWKSINTTISFENSFALLNQDIDLQAYFSENFFMQNGLIKYLFDLIANQQRKSVDLIAYNEPIRIPKTGITIDQDSNGIEYKQLPSMLQYPESRAGMVSYIKELSATYDSVEQIAEMPITDSKVLKISAFYDVDIYDGMISGSYKDFNNSTLVGNADQLFVTEVVSGRPMNNITLWQDIENATNAISKLSSSLANAYYFHNATLCAMYDSTPEILFELNSFKTSSDDEITTALANPIQKIVPYDIFKLIPGITTCMYEPLKIYVVFKNNSDIHFIHDYALDLDLTCYIDDIFESKKRVGYHNGFYSTDYISWGGDKHAGKQESLVIDVHKYFKYHPSAKRLDICLNACWHNESELTPDDVYVLINWNMLVEKVPIMNIGMTSSDCKNKTMRISIDQDNVLTYSLFKPYYAFKVTYKDSFNNTSDHVPDIQVGLINLPDEKLGTMLWSYGWKKANQYYYYLNEKVGYKGTDLDCNYMTFIVPDAKIEDLNDHYIQNQLKLLMNNLFKLNVEPNFTLDELTFKSMYYGLNYMVEDDEMKEQGLDLTFIQSVYLQRGKLSKSTRQGFTYEIDAILPTVLKNLQTPSHYDGFIDFNSVVSLRKADLDQRVIQLDTNSINGKKYKVEYSYDDTDIWIEYKDDIVISENHDIIIRIIDKVTGEIVSENIYVVDDIEERQLEIYVNADPTSVTNGSVTISATFIGEPVECQYSFDETNWRTYVSPFVLYENKTIYFKARRGQNVVVSTYSVTNIDKLAPADPMIMPQVGRLTHLPYLVDIHYSYDSVVKKYSVSGSEFEDYVSAVLVNDNCVISAYAEDEAGNNVCVSEEITNFNFDIPAEPIVNEGVYDPDNKRVAVTIDYDPISVVRKYAISSENVGEFSAPIDYISTFYLPPENEENISKFLISAYCETEAENSSSTTYIVSGIDIVPPDMPTYEASPSSLTNGDVTVSIDFAEDAVVKKYAIDDDDYKDYVGPFTVSSNCIINTMFEDSNKNRGYDNSYGVYWIDKEAPTQPDLSCSPTGPTVGPVIVTADFHYEENDDIDQRLYSKYNQDYWYPYPTTGILISENCDVYAKSIDLAGNESEIGHIYVENIQVLGFEFALTPTDPTNGIVSGEFNVNGDSFVSAQYHTSLDDEQQWHDYSDVVEFRENCNVSARMWHNNDEMWIEKTYQINNIYHDNIGISFEFDESVTTSPVNVKLNVTNSTDLMVNKEYRYPGIEWDVYKEETGISVPSSCILSARATDEAGNSSLSTCIIDNIFSEFSYTPTQESELSKPTNKNIVLDINFNDEGTTNYYASSYIDSDIDWHQYTSRISIGENCILSAKAVRNDKEYVAQLLEINNIDRVNPVAPTIAISPTAVTSGAVHVVMSHEEQEVILQYKTSIDQTNDWQIYDKNNGFDVDDNCIISGKAIDLAGNESSISTYEIMNIFNANEMKDLIIETIKL